MNRVKVLDSTLRDGGYINNWNFGSKNIKNIISKLSDADIDIIECGFLSNEVTYNSDSTKFNSVESLEKVIPDNLSNTQIVAMINYGEFELDDIPDYSGSVLKGIRVAFHKDDLDDALKFCQGIKEKGYKVYIQPMVSISYSDVEFIDLITKSNEISPYAFYVVDSFGVMKKNDLMRFFYLVDHNLNKDIWVGYHSHNNLQLAYSNAQALVDLKVKRKLIIDSSVFGMGRGAGNLNTELFIEYLNDTNGRHYKSKSLLQIIDEVLNNIYLINYWGYSLPHYISAKHNCHPNYASHLSNKDTLTAEDISNILMMMDGEKKNNFDKGYIESLYVQYQSHKMDDAVSKDKLKNIFKGKEVVVIAPGTSINKNIDSIIEQCINPDSICVSVNFNPDNIDVDYIFVSNLKRFEQLGNVNAHKLITTSNVITEKDSYYKINYVDLLNEDSAVADNAGLMVLKLLMSLDVSSVKLAGYDGYSYDAYENYAYKDLTLVKKKSVVDSLNEGMEKVLQQISKQVDIQFITQTRYEKL